MGNYNVYIYNSDGEIVESGFAKNVDRRAIEESWEKIIKSNPCGFAGFEIVRI